jgi:hypothetical protein
MEATGSQERRKRQNQNAETGSSGIRGEQGRHQNAPVRNAPVWPRANAGTSAIDAELIDPAFKPTM